MSTEKRTPVKVYLTAEENDHLTRQAKALDIERGQLIRLRALGDPRFHYSPVNGDHAIGMYDMEGYYCTYCPPVQTPGVKDPIGRFVRHPWSDEERKRQEAFA